MQRSLTTCALLAVLTLAGCGGLDTIVLTEERQVALPKPVEHAQSRFVPLAYEHIANLPNDEVPAEDLDSVKLTRLEVVLPRPSPTRNFDFIRELKVYIQTPTTPSRLVAQKGPMPQGSSVATLDIQNVELREYLSSDNAQIRVLFLGRQPAEQLDVRVEADFLVDVKLKEILF